jgi:hypothetical protein
VHTVATLGRLGWQKVTRYGRRARNDAGRRTEAAIGAAVLNRMLAAGQPKSVRCMRTGNGALSSR